MLRERGANFTEQERLKKGAVSTTWFRRQMQFQRVRSVPRHNASARYSKEVHLSDLKERSFNVDYYTLEIGSLHYEHNAIQSVSQLFSLPEHDVKQILL